VALAGTRDADHFRRESRASTMIPHYINPDSAIASLIGAFVILKSLDCIFTEALRLGVENGDGIAS
jgi:hypothetical protein